MKSLRGRPRSRWLLLMLLTSLVLSGVVSRPSGEPAVCGMSCCSVLPSCRDAWRVDCNCPEMDTMTLRNGAIPPTAAQVKFRNFKNLVIEEDAIKDRPLLTNLEFDNTTEIKISPAGLGLHNNNKLSSVRFSGIAYLKIETGAFSGLWQPTTSITMSHVDRLHLEREALNIEFDSIGPILLVEHVQNLDLAAHGLSESMSHVTMSNVSMDKCHEGNFGNSFSTTWKNVNIEEALPKCYHSSNQDAEFEAQALNLATAYPRAFSGSAKAVVITDSQFGDLREKAFDIRLARMILRNCRIERMMSHSLYVLASGASTIEYIRIDELHKRAFIGFRLLKSPQLPSQPHLHINQLEILRPDNGSLAISRTTGGGKLEASFINVMSRDIPICPMYRYARTLVEAKTSGPMTECQRIMADALTGNVRCSRLLPTDAVLGDESDDTGPENGTEDSHGSIAEDRHDPSAPHTMNRDGFTADTENRHGFTAEHEESQGSSVNTEDSFSRPSGHSVSKLDSPSTGDASPSVTSQSEDPAHLKTGDASPSVTSQSETSSHLKTGDASPTVTSQSEDSSHLKIGVSVGVVTFVILAVLAVCLYRRQVQNRPTDNDGQTGTDSQRDLEQQPLNRPATAQFVNDPSRDIPGIHLR